LNGSNMYIRIFPHIQPPCLKVRFPEHLNQVIYLPSARTTPSRYSNKKLLSFGVVVVLGVCRPLLTFALPSLVTDGKLPTLGISSPTDGTASGGILLSSNIELLALPRGAGLISASWSIGMGVVAGEGLLKRESRVCLCSCVCLPWPTLCLGEGRGSIGEMMESWREV